MAIIATGRRDPVENALEASLDTEPQSGRPALAFARPPRVEAELAAAGVVVDARGQCLQQRRLWWAKHICVEGFRVVFLVPGLFG